MENMVLVFKWGGEEQHPQSEDQTIDYDKTKI